MESITIVLPIPHRQLRANASCHWAELGRHRRKARQDAKLATFAVGGAKLWWPQAYATVRWYARTAHKQDETNINFYLKPYFDGIEDAGVVKNDRDIHVVAYEQHKDAKDPRVEIELRKERA